MITAGEIALSQAYDRARTAIDKKIHEGDHAGAIREAALASTGGYWDDEISWQRERFAKYAAEAIAMAVLRSKLR